MDEVDGEDAAGLRGQELLPRWAAGCGVDPSGMQEFDEFALHATAPPLGLSVAMRITSFRIVAAVDGRPGRRRLE